jgi:hypothetical protein
VLDFRWKMPDTLSELITLHPSPITHRKTVLFLLNLKESACETVVFVPQYVQLFNSVL